jgi:hypothetical protein
MNIKDNRILLTESPLGNSKVINLKDEILVTESVNGISLPESVKDTSILIKGPVQRANIENRNGRIYPYNVLNRELIRLQEIIKKNGGILGELDHPTEPVVEMQRVPMVIRKLWWDNKNPNDMMAIAEILDPSLNPNAGIACSILNAGLPLGISSRGLGSIEYKDGVDVVCEDYEMVTWDLVSDPSTQGAVMKHYKANKVNEENNRNIQADIIKEIKYGEDNLGKELQTFLDTLI